MTSPIPVSSNAIPTMMLKIESISDMKPMSRAVARAVSVTHDVAGAIRDRLPTLVLRGGGLVIRPRWIARILGRLVAAHLRVREPTAARERVLAHDLRLGERLPSSVYRLPRPLLGVFLDGRIGRWAERDSFALDVISREAESPHAEDDHDEPEDDQHPSRDIAADSQESALFHSPPLSVVKPWPDDSGTSGTGSPAATAVARAVDIVRSALAGRLPGAAA